MDEILDQNTEDDASPEESPLHVFEEVRHDYSTITTLSTFVIGPAVAFGVWKTSTAVYADEGVGPIITAVIVWALASFVAASTIWGIYSKTSAARLRAEAELLNVAENTDLSNFGQLLELLEKCRSSLGGDNYDRAYEHIALVVKQTDATSAADIDERTKEILDSKLANIVLNASHSKLTAKDMSLACAILRSYRFCSTARSLRIVRSLTDGRSPKEHVTQYNRLKSEARFSLPALEARLSEEAKVVSLLRPTDTPSGQNDLLRAAGAGTSDNEALLLRSMPDHVAKDEELLHQHNSSG